MPIGPDGKWFPAVSARQARLLANNAPIQLVEGPRKSTKTIACLNKLCAHAWLRRNARISFLSKTLTNNADGGSWVDLVKVVLPQWIEGGFGMEWVTKPKLSALTHKMYCEVTNIHGGTSEFMLDSLKDEHRIDEVYKNKRFTCVYIAEAMNFKRYYTFEVVLEALRNTLYEEAQAENEFLLLLDTNPAPEGESHWIFQTFHRFRNMTEQEIRKEFGPNETKIKGMLMFRERLSVEHFTVDDNIWMSDDERTEMQAKYAFDLDAYERDWLGLWKRQSMDGFFGQVFRPDFHVVGNTPSVIDPNPEILMPSENCTELLTGWDPGDVNNAIMVVEKVMVDHQDGKKTDVIPVFRCLDELVLLKTHISISELVESVLMMMEYWEKQIGKPVLWRHWSDRSAWEYRRYGAETYLHREIFAISDGKIELQAAFDAQRSTQQRIMLTRKLLFEGRLFISARCEQLTNSIAQIRPVKSGRMAPGDPLKHAWDAMTYAVCSEAWSEIVELSARKAGKPNEPGVVVRVRV